MGIKLVSVGEITADYYPRIDKTFVGGISLNFAVHAKRCGAEQVSMVSALGADENGQMILARLAKEQIDTSHISVLPGKTSHCEIVVFDNGERYFPPNSYHQHVLASYEPSAADLEFVRQHDILVSRFDISYTKTTFNRVMLDDDFTGKKVADFGDWFDYEGRHPAVYPYLDQVDVAFISGDNSTIETFLPFSKNSRAQIIVTLGAEGSVALNDGEIIHQPAVRVPRIVDTTGCGDAFQAAFTVAHFQGLTLKQSLAAGAENAAKVLQHYGAS